MGINPVAIQHHLVLEKVVDFQREVGRLGQARLVLYWGPRHRQYWGQGRQQRQCSSEVRFQKHHVSR